MTFVSWVSSLAYPNLLGTKGYVVVCCCCPVLVSTNPRYEFSALLADLELHYLSGIVFSTQPLTGF